MRSGWSAMVVPLQSKNSNSRPHRRFRSGLQHVFDADHMVPVMQKVLIVLGLLIVAAGLLWPWLSQLPFGRLPGDIAVERENSRFYFPIVTCIVLSVIATVILRLFR